MMSRPAYEAQSPKPGSVWVYPTYLIQTKRALAKRSYDAGYQLVNSSQSFSVRLSARSHERGGVSSIRPITNMDKRTDSAASYFLNEKWTLILVKYEEVKL